MATNPDSSAAVSAAGPKKGFVRHIPTIARILLGFVFFAGGLMGLLMMLGFIPPPKEAGPEKLVAFSTALMNTGYLFQLLKGTETLCGLLLLANRFVPLALAMLAPIVLNIFCTHVFLAPSGLVTAIVILGLELYLAWAYRNAFRPMLAARVTPA